MTNGSLTSIYLAKTTGGRCYNNQPTHIYIERTLVNIDIIGCYGNGLKHQLYPIERLVIVSYPRQSKQNQHDSLRKFLKRYRKDLIAGL